MSSKTSAAKVERSGTQLIHHATMNRANENGVTFEEVRGGGFRAVHSESGKKATAPKAKEALEKVLKLINVDEDAEEDGEDDGEGKVIVKEKYKKLYQPHGGNCGDKLAKALTAFRATGPEAFAKVCRENKLPPARWEGKNKGLQWMALSNILRHRVMRNEEVIVDGEKITGLK